MSQTMTLQSLENVPRIADARRRQLETILWFISLTWLSPKAATMNAQTPVKAAEINAQSRFTVSRQAILQEVGDETVILDLASGTYFGLNSDGARIWTLFDEGKTIGETCDVLLGEYEVERDRLEADLRKLADQLIERELIKVKTQPARNEIRGEALGELVSREKR